MDEKTFKTRTKKMGCDYYQRGREAASFCRRRCNWKTVNSIRNINWCELSGSMPSKIATDMINKLKIVEEESDETQYWLELLVESGLVSQEQIASIYKETDEILAMTIASIKTLRNRKS